MPRVSMIIPVYNKEKYIQRTLDSVRNQVFQDYEVIIVNDGSTDRSGEIVQAYTRQDSRFLLFNIENHGVSYARNFGLQKANGRWIQFLDGDDLIDCNYLCHAVNEAEENNVDILFTNFRMLDENGGEHLIAHREQGVCDAKRFEDIFMKYQFTNGFFGYISNKLISRQLINTNHIVFPEHIKLAEDLYFYTELYRKMDTAYFSDRISFDYVTEGSDTKDYANVDYRAQLEIQLQIKNWFVNNQKYRNYRETIDNKISTYAYCIVFYGYERGENLKEQLSLIWENPDVMESLTTKNSGTLERIILHFIQKKQLNLIRTVLCARKYLRRIVRRK